MKIDKIKNALKVRIASLNLNPVTITPIVTSASIVPNNFIVPEKSTVSPKFDAPFVKTKPSEKNNIAQIKTKGDGENVTPPVTDVSLVTQPVPAEKSSRKTTTRKAKENSDVSISSATDITLNDIETIVVKHLKAGRDYDRLPNTTKPTLLKSGAEILANVFGFRTMTKVINRVEDYNKQFVLYEVCVTVFDKDGNVVAEGLGSCNSRERKYLKTDFATNLNTVLKIAKKRAFVDAILTATHASRVFTQDVEDIVNLQIVSNNKGKDIR